MHMVVTGLASSRLTEISSSQISQVPKVPFSIRAKASSIFFSRNFSRSRKRNTMLCVYSEEARSISSGRSSVSKAASSVRVLRALRSRLRLDSSRIFLNRFKSFWFTLPPPRVAATVARVAAILRYLRRRGRPLPDGADRVAAAGHGGAAADRPRFRGEGLDRHPGAGGGVLLAGGGGAGLAGDGHRTRGVRGPPDRDHLRAGRFDGGDGE